MSAIDGMLDTAKSGLPKHKESRKSQDVRTIQQKALPLSFKQRIDSENKHYDTERREKEELFQDPQGRKLMVWLLPNMENTAECKNQLREALKKKKITKQELMEIINKQHMLDYKDRALSQVQKHKNRYSEDHVDNNESFNDSQLTNAQLKMMTIKETFEPLNSRKRMDRNNEGSRLFAKSSNSPLHTLTGDVDRSTNSISIKPSTWNEKDRSAWKNYSFIQNEIAGSPHKNGSACGNEAKIKTANSRELTTNFSNPGLLSSNYQADGKFFNRGKQHQNEIKLSELLSNRSSWDVTKEGGVKLPEISKFSIMKKKAGVPDIQFQDFQEEVNEESDKYYNERSKSLMKKRQSSDKASSSIKRHFKNKKIKKNEFLDSVYNHNTNK